MGDDDAERVRRSELIPSMTRALAAAVTTAEVAQATVSSLLTTTEADEVAFAVVQDRGRRLRVIAATGTTLLGGPRSVVDLVTDPEPPVAGAIRSGGIVVELARSTPSSVRAYAPVFEGDRVAGVIAIAFARSTEPTDAELSVLEGTADRVGIALERARLFRAERTAHAAADRAKSRVERLQAATAELAKGLSQRDVTRAVLREAVRAVRAHGGALALPSDDDRLELVATEGIAERFGNDDGEPMHLPITSPSAIASAYRDGSLVVVPDHADWVARFPAGALLFDGVANSQFSVPILAQGRPIGALGLYFRDERRPTEVDVRLVTSLTEQAAIALERARLVERERAAAERTRQLQAVTAALAKAATERDVGRVLSDHARRVGAIDATVDLRDTREIGATGAALPPGWGHDDDSTGVVELPLVEDDVDIGVLSVRLPAPRSPTEEERQLWTDIGRQAAQALVRTRLYADLQRSRQRLARLQQVTSALSAARTPAEVATEVLDRGLPALGAATGWLYVVDEHDDALTLIRPDGSSDTQGRVELTAAVPVADVVRTQGSVLLPSADEARQRYPAMFGTGEPVPRGERAWAWLPLRVGSHVVGGMGLSFATERSFDGQERWALETLADQVAQALERSRSYAAEHRIAAVLQESLLPSALRNVGPARVAARYLPAATEASVGGDWFEMLDLPGERLAVSVGDVVGSGIGAAAAMGQIRSAVRVLALAGKHPMELLETMDAFAESVEGAPMSTAVCAELDTRTGHITYACAGHPPPLVVGPSGARFLEGGRRPPLSMPPANAAVSDASDHLEPGETLVLYTDGLIERRGEAVDEGLRRLAEVATQLADRGPDALAERIVSQLLPDGAADDAAVLCVRYEPVTAATTVPDFVIHLPAAAEELAALRSAIRGWSMRAAIPVDVTEEIMLAIGEACANAIEHAYRDRPGDLTVELKLRSGDEVQAEIRDDGQWRDEGRASTRGRGMTLMRELMDTVDVRPSASGTTVVMRRRVEASQSGPRDGENTPPRGR